MHIALKNDFFVQEFFVQFLVFEIWSILYVVDFAYDTNTLKIDQNTSKSIIYKNMIENKNKFYNFFGRKWHTSPETNEKSIFRFMLFSFDEI